MFLNKDDWTFVRYLISKQKNLNKINNDINKKIMTWWTVTQYVGYKFSLEEKKIVTRINIVGSITISIFIKTIKNSWNKNDI